MTFLILTFLIPKFVGVTFLILTFLIPKFVGVTFLILTFLIPKFLIQNFAHTRDLVEGDDVIERVLGTSDAAHGDLGFCDHQSVVD